MGALLVLIIGGVLVGPGLVDWNKYKNDIQAQAKNATGRDLVINGNNQADIKALLGLLQLSRNCLTICVDRGQKVFGRQYIEVTSCDTDDKVLL